MATPEELLQQAQALNNEEKYAEVVELLADDVLRSFQNADLYAEKAEAYFRLQKKDLCSEILEKALLIDKNNAKANHFIGNIYVELKQNDKAIEAYLKAIKSDSHYANPYYGLGIIYRGLKEYDKAIENYNKAIEIDSEFVQPYNGLGNVYCELKKYDQSIENYNKAIEIDPKFIYSYNGLGNVYYELKKYDKAIETYNIAIPIDPKYVTLYYGLGDAYTEIKEYDNAIETFNRAIEIDPKYINSYIGLGNVYYYLNEFSKAIKVFTEAIGINDKASSPYYNRALSYNYLKNYPKALADYEKYLELTKGNLDYFSSIAQSKITELKKIIKSPEYTRISELVEKIKELLLFQDNCVTHYTSLSGAQALILESSKFRLSEGAFLNDTSEGRDLFKFLPTFDSKYSATDDAIALPFTQKPFIGSFVAETKHDDLTLWRMYGKENKDEAKGCAITIEREKLLEDLKESLITDSKTDIPEKMEMEFNFYRVAYRIQDQGKPFIIPGANDKEVTLNEYLTELQNVIILLKEDNNTSEIQDIQERLNSIAYLFKSAEYQYEYELRLVIEGIGFKKIINMDSNLPRVYIELVPICPVIRKITLGPKIERADEWAAAFYYSLDKQDFHPEILISHLPFK